MSDTFTAAVVALLLGVLVAAAELVSRYRDDPARAVMSLPAAAYVTVNAAASAAAFGLIRAFEWDFGASGTQKLVTQVLVAGFGSAALFRSSLFNITAGDQVVGVGPSAVLNVILSAADRAVDRQRASFRAQNTTAAMKDVSFERSADSLAVFCFGAMQNASNEEVKAIDDRISILRDSKNSHLPDQVKSYVLGLALATVVGDKVLAEAAAHIKAVTQPLPPPDPDAAETRIIEALMGGPVPTMELQVRAGVDIASFGTLMRDLVTSRVVAISGSGDTELAELVT
ncbi:hypothetical protein [Jiangella alkaliphila]|uniref:Uncharacterized protein n=1 Tax=Jiangella alkaliphila TaxID=419479 RepID=A0A1H2KJ41_9ACTN|nr:hypothetical protein [Jiangella alkaliphila]SDU68355.1 hypothetical protein SAMN04488563_3863 [Jiangella alkaliphila]